MEFEGEVQAYFRSLKEGRRKRFVFLETPSARRRFREFLEREYPNLEKRSSYRKRKDVEDQLMWMQRCGDCGKWLIAQERLEEFTISGTVFPYIVSYCGECEEVMFTTDPEKTPGSVKLAKAKNGVLFGHKLRRH